MVNDNEIKATVSPFAIREGEIKSFDGKDGYVSMNQIVHKIDLGHINEVNNKLDQLVKSKILTRYFFNSDDGKGIYRIYCMEKMGKYLLASREKECKWQPSDNAKPVAMIKKRLAGNQTIIA